AAPVVPWGGSGDRDRGPGSARSWAGSSGGERIRAGRSGGRGGPTRVGGPDRWRAVQRGPVRTGRAAPGEPQAPRGSSDLEASRGYLRRKSGMITPAGFAPSFVLPA